MDTKKMKVLVIGGGGREHAIIWALLKSGRCGQIFFAPGNGIFGHLGSKVINVNIKATDIGKLLEFAKENGIDLTFVGPEDPLILGIVDAFREAGLAIFGPTKAAARLEGSKAWMKRLCWKYSIPTAPGGVFDNYDDALAYVKQHGAPIVVKVDGPALGKGAFVCPTVEEAEAALRRIFIDKEFGDSGKLAVIEDCLSGREVSMMSICCGTDSLALPASQDHKRIGDGDLGPNTGGMGAYSPLPWLDEKTIDLIQRTIIQPLLEAMAAEGCPYGGLLYPGIILTERGPMLLECNCRFGDPETQVVLPLIASDLLEILSACAQGNLQGLKLEVLPGICVGVVMASANYPGVVKKGFPIIGIEFAEQHFGAVVFQAGTAIKDETLVTNGGRVACVTMVGPTAEETIKKVYEAVAYVKFAGEQHRTDIAHQALAQ